MKTIKTRDREKVKSSVSGIQSAEHLMKRSAAKAKSEAKQSLKAEETTSTNEREYAIERVEGALTQTSRYAVRAANKTIANSRGAAGYIRNTGNKDDLVNQRKIPNSRIKNKEDYLSENPGRIRRYKAAYKSDPSEDGNNNTAQDKKIRRRRIMRYAARKKAISNVKHRDAKLKSVKTTAISVLILLILFLSVVFCAAVAIGGFISSPAAILYSADLIKDSEMSIKDAVKIINSEYQERLTYEESCSGLNYCIIEGKKASWSEVLAVYAIKYTEEFKDEVFTVSEEKLEEIRKVYMDMNSYDVSIEERVPLDADDGAEEVATLVVRINGKTAMEMAEYYSFSPTDIKMLETLLNADYKDRWTAVIYGISSDAGMVETALSQLGEIGGEPYWSWWGYRSRVEWCAIFVSWCAEQCGYLDSYTLPKFENCQWGAQWFKLNSTFEDRNAEPETGWIVFFDWGDDGICDHVGLVEKYEDGFIYTVEGNSGDMCRQRSYPYGSPLIYGYGVPSY